MNARRWAVTCGLAIVAFSGSEVMAQIRARGEMRVLVKLSPDQELWYLAPRMASATGMKLVGVSPSTHSAVFSVPNETSLTEGTVAARNQVTLSDGFPGAFVAYNYGLNYPTPVDVEQTPPPSRRGEGGSPGRRPGRFMRMSEQDRQAARDWYYQGRDIGSRLRVGAVLDQYQRSHSYPAPADLVRRLRPVPGDHRYFIIWGHLVLVDGRYSVLDFISLDSR